MDVGQVGRDLKVIRENLEAAQDVQRDRDAMIAAYLEDVAEQLTSCAEVLSNDDSTEAEREAALTRLRLEAAGLRSGAAAVGGERG